MKTHRKKFKDVSLKTKLGSVLLLFALLALLNFLSISYFKNLQKSEAAVIDAAGRQRMLCQRMAFFAEMIIAGKEQVREGLREVIDLHGVSLRALKMGGVVPGIGGGKALPASQASTLPTLLLAEELWADYKKQAEIILNEPLYMDSTDSLTKTKQQLHGMNPKVALAIRFVEKNATDMLSRNNALVKAYVKDSESNQRYLHYLSWFLLVVNAALIMVGFYVIDKFIIKPIQWIRHGAQHLAQGDLSQKIPYESKDEIGCAVKDLNMLKDNLQIAALFAQAIGEGSLTEELQAVSEQDQLGIALMGMRNQLQEVAQQDKKRQWTAEGLTQFSDVLRADQSDVVTLAQKVIHYLVKYLQANQGGLFVVNEDEPEDMHLELLALYAWDRQKFRSKRIEKGEGLAGMVWQEAEMVYLTEVPEDYVQITSGLGKATPRSILLVPLKEEKEVLGVIEIASFQQYEDYQIEFIQKVANNLASAIAMSRVNYRTKILLEQTQQQGEEMRAQEEEMRQNMEELQALQEGMLRKEQAYIVKIKELEVAQRTASL